MKLAADSGISQGELNGRCRLLLEVADRECVQDHLVDQRVNCSRGADAEG